MILFRRFAPLAAGVVTVLGFESILSWPQYYQLVAPAVIFAGIAAVLFIRQTRRDATLFLTAPTLLVTGGLLFLLFTEIDRKLFAHILSVAVSGLLWYYLEQVFAFQFQTPSYQAFALENISGYMNVASVFFVVSTLYGLHFFVGYPLWLVISLIALILFIASVHTLAMGKAEWLPRLTRSVLLTVLGTEIAFALLFLPSGYQVNGLLLTTFFYVVVNLTHYDFRSTLDRRLVKRYVLIGVFVVVLTMLTASWR